MTDKSAMKARTRRAKLPLDEQGKSADIAGTFGQDLAPDVRAEAHALAQYFPDFFRVDSLLHGPADNGFIQAAVTSADGSRYWHAFALASTPERPVPIPAYKLGEVVEPMMNAARAAGILLQVRGDKFGVHVEAIVKDKVSYEDGPHFGLSLARVMIVAAKRKAARA